MQRLASQADRLKSLERSKAAVKALNGRGSTAFSNIDFEGVGRQIGFFNIPHSPDDDAWGVVRIPLAVLSNGSGPTVVLEAGNHGDEYEGQIVLGEVIRDLDLSRLAGRLIIIPSINAPASKAGKRTSPADGLNMNRVFPGDHNGSITQQIAAFVTDEILSRGDALLSLHSGGTSLDIVPCTMVQPAADEDLTNRNLKAALAFGAPTTVLIDNLGDTRMCVATAVANGLTCVSTEMAGTGTVDDAALAMCREGVVRVLRHWGVLDVGDSTLLPQTKGGYYKVLGSSAYVIAPSSGVYEHYHPLGTHVRKGQPAGKVHFVTDPGREPVEVSYGVDGIVFARRHPGRIRPGNVCCVVASPDSGRFD